MSGRGGRGHGVTKTAAERHLRDVGNVACYRFATAFALSNRIRFDLLGDDGVDQAKINKDPLNHERTFIHVRDIAGVSAFALANWVTLREDLSNVVWPVGLRRTTPVAALPEGASALCRHVR